MDKISLANDIIQLTNNSFDDFSPRISLDYVTWYGDPDNNDSEIYLYDDKNKKLVRVTDNNFYDSPSDLSGDSVVWNSFDGEDDEIYLYNGSKTVRLTDNQLFDYSPQIDGDKVVWYALPITDVNNEIYFYDGSKTIQLTDNNSSEYNPQISGNNIVWSGYDDNDDEIYLYDGTKIVRLTDNNNSDNSPQISGNNIVWSGYDGNDDEIYFYDGTKIVRLTDNSTYDYNVKISGKNIVWQGYRNPDDPNPEIFLYDGNKTVQITDNELFENSPQIDGDRVVWSAFDGNDDEIYLYDGDITQLTDNDINDLDPQISGDKVVWSGSDGSDLEIYLYNIPKGFKLNGTKDNDVLTGGRGSDTISGFGGDDVLEGLDGNDRLFGNNGNDLITAGDGTDVAEGGPGNDIISGDRGNDDLKGNRGNDAILGGEGNDNIDGGSGSDRLLGEAGDDSIFGMSGNDTIDGGNDNDLLSGGAGSDRITGGSGNDNLSGGAASDTLIGGFDSDNLDGGAGNDRLVGVRRSAVSGDRAGFGRGEIDTLTGGKGRDIFALGNKSHVYYDDGDPLTTGESDYALITDYDRDRDSLERKGTSDLYKLDYFTNPDGSVDAAMVYDPGVTARDETIAILQGSPAASSATSKQTKNNNPSSENSSPLSLLAGLVEGKDYSTGEIIVKLKGGTDRNAIASIQARLGATVLETTQTLGIQRWAIATSNIRDAIVNLSEDPAIEYIQPNFIVRATAKTPTDPSFGELWGLNNTGQTGGTADADIDAPEAWELTTGDKTVVGVIDTGVDYTHPDLNDNMWTNPGEIAGDGIDNDGNGFVDDIYGYDFVYEDSDPMDVDGHGTHVSGTIAAEANNNEGVTGVNWNAKIMALKFLNDEGIGSSFDAIEAVEYAMLMKKNYGVNINLTNNSWGGGGYDRALYDAIAAAGQTGQLFIAAAGNYSMDNDSDPFYPATYDLDNVISVAATTHNDTLADFSNYGATTVDLAAPGDSVLSTVPGNNYTVYSGTSMATPHVSGVASLLWSQNANLSPQEVKEFLLTTVDPLPALQGKMVSGGRLNAFNALSASGPMVEIIGTKGDDLITGTNRRDRILALGGNDIISSLASNDEILGGSGNDRITSGEGKDTVDGGIGNDTVFGNQGDDSLSGDKGRDTIEGGEGDDIIDGGNDRDRISGGKGDDSLLGQAGADTLTGGLGNDSVDGGGGNDRIIGVDPASGYGAGELDVLTGLSGNDTFVLGDKSNVFYSDGDPVTTGEFDYAAIADFNSSQDVIQLHGAIDQYYLDLFTTSSNVVNAALVYDSGDAARGELISILQNVSAGLTIGAPAFVFV